MRECQPGGEHRGRGDDRSKRPELEWVLHMAGDSKLVSAGAGRVEARDGRPQRPGQIRRAKSLLVSAHKGSC